MQVEPRGERRFAVHGTPADCVLIALNGLLGARGADLVLSGVNAGSNLANDIGSSGTVGACFEAAERGVPAIAFSQQHAGGRRSGPLGVRGAPDPAPVAATVRRAVLAPPGAERELPRAARRRGAGGDRGDAQRLARGALLDRREAPDPRAPGSSTSTRSGGKNEPNEPDCDLDLALRGYVTVTPLGLDQTRHGDLEGMRARLCDALPPESEAG